jgi:hypothetical protein
MSGVVEVALADAREGDTFSGIQAGTRVEGKLFRAGGKSLYVHSALPPVAAWSWSEIKVTREVTIPTQPGIYRVGAVETRLNNTRRLMLNTHGVWFWLDFTGRVNGEVLVQIDDPEKTVSEYPGITLVYGGAS